MKCNDEDKGILLRFIEREGMAENFLTRIDYLPPLNFNWEKTKKNRSF